MAEVRREYIAARRKWSCARGRGSTIDRIEAEYNYRAAKRLLKSSIRKVKAKANLSRL